MTGSDVGYIIGGAGFALAVVREWIAAGERRRARPVVIVHEVRRRHFTDGPNEAASVYLTNESAASAFNVRFGIKMGEVHVGWKHDLKDSGPNRINVLGPGERYPAEGTLDIVIPNPALWWIKADPDVGRAYWAYYQSAGGDKWYSLNPHERTDDLRITRLGLKSRKIKALDKQVREGEKILRRAVAEALEPLNESRRELNQRTDDNPSEWTERHPGPGG